MLFSMCYLNKLGFTWIGLFEVKVSFSHEVYPFSGNPFQICFFSAHWGKFNETPCPPPQV